MTKLKIDPENKNQLSLMIMGPTASGKTQLANDLAQSFNGEIINVDAFQIYQYMDIGTNKISSKERKLNPHYLIDFVHPMSFYTVADFKKDCLEAIKKIKNKKKLPILVGGTGLYFLTLCQDDYLKFLPGPHFEFRKEIRKEIKEKGLDFFYRKMILKSPQLKDKIHPNDEKRIIRILEIQENSSKPIEELWKEARESVQVNTVNFIKIGLYYTDRQKHYDHINQRCLKMLNRGLVEEVSFLRSIGCKDYHNSMKGIGYSHFLKYLNKKINFKDALEVFQRDSRRFSKRQLTFFRNRINDIDWNESNNIKKIKESLKKIIK